MYQVRRSTHKRAGDAIDVDGSGLNDSEYRDCVSNDWEVPHENRPAPRPLLLVQGFVNTRDLEEGTDVLQKRSDAHAWLTNAGLWCRSALPSARELEEARELREAIRQILAVQEGGRATTSPPSALRAYARSARMRVQIRDSGAVSLMPAGDRMEAVFGTLFTIIRDARARRHLVTAEGVRESRVPLGVLRPLPRPAECLVRDDHLWQPPQEPPIPRASPSTTVSSRTRQRTETNRPDRAWAGDPRMRSRQHDHAP